MTGRRVDPAYPVNIYFRQQVEARRDRAAPAAGEPLRDAGPKKAGTPGTKGKQTNGLTDEVLSQLDLPGTADMGDRSRLDMAKTAEQIQGLQIKNEEARNKLVSRDLIRQFFGELYTIETMEFLTLAERLSPEIASKFGIDDQTIIVEVGKYIQREVSKSLEHIEMTTEKFLKGFQVEGG